MAHPTGTAISFTKRQGSDKLKRFGGGASEFSEGIFDQGFGAFSPVKKDDD